MMLVYNTALDQTRNKRNYLLLFFITIIFCIKLSVLTLFVMIDFITTKSFNVTDKGLKH